MDIGDDCYKGFLRKLKNEEYLYDWVILNLVDIDPDKVEYYKTQVPLTTIYLHAIKNKVKGCYEVSSNVESLRRMR